MNSPACMSSTQVASVATDALGAPGTPMTSLSSKDSTTPRLTTCPVCDGSARWSGEGKQRVLTCGSCARVLSGVLVSRIRAVLHRTRIDTVLIPGTITDHDGGLIQ